MTLTKDQTVTAVAIFLALCLLAPYAGCHIITSAPIALPTKDDLLDDQNSNPAPRESRVPANQDSAPSKHGDLNEIQELLAE